jgi:pimeloyl-ACP methyl ester carboxylesterase
VGDWNGRLAVGAVSLRINVSVTQAPDGSLSGTLTSPDQGPTKIPLSEVTFAAAKLSFAVPSIGGRFEATWDAAKGGWAGTWSQGAAIPLLLLPGKSAVISRPQEPKPPFPYAQEEVSIDSEPGVRLACTLTRPESRGPFPAALLVSGSGAQDRDESLMGHKPFAVLADYLSRAGIAVLRCDDRGTAKSTGNFAAALTRDFVTDATAAVVWLRRQEGIGKVGLIGHSEGGVIGPMVAERDPELAFLVMMAGPGTPMTELLAAQSEAVGLSMGLSADQAAHEAKITRRLVAAVSGAPSNEEAKAVAVRVLTESGAKPDIIARQVPMVSSPWFRELAAYDPRPALAKLRVPLLAINGSTDTQVRAKPNLAAIRDATRGDNDVTIVELPGLNHLFQTSSTGAPTDYGVIEETFSLAALKLIGDWILKRR